MKTSIALALSGVALVLGSFTEAAVAQARADAPTAQSEAAFGALPGRWVRPDGGYVITIKSVDASGRIDASYANPNPLPFARAEATRDGKMVKLFFELRAGG